jgi:hypothetical protein
MKRSVAISGAVLLLASEILAQRAQLGLRGRVRESGRPSQKEPIRRLPRRIPAEVTSAPVVSPLDRYIQEQLARQSVAPLSADRLRPLVRSVPGVPLAGVSAASGDPLPRRLDIAGILKAFAPAFVIPQPEPVESVPTRWRIGFPAWQRYADQKLDTVYAQSRWWDPFNVNVLKGDLPLLGDKTFLNFTGSSETVVDTRRIPTQSVPSAARPGDFGFFGRGEQLFLRQSFRFSFDLFQGAAGFRPVDAEFRVTPEVNINYLAVRENGIARVDVRERTRRTDSTIGFQEMFIEKRLFTNSASAFRRKRDADDRGSAYFDFTSLRMGIQRFTSDFRGFVFSDEQPGVRLFGTFRNNVFQYNLAYFNMLEKDTNSGLNRWRRRNQSVYAANLYWQDALGILGYNLNFSALYNNDQPSFHIDKNGFLVRPALLGRPQLHKVRAAYAGVSGDGHIGRYNISHAFYHAFGRDDFNPVPAMNNAQRLSAQLAALEIAYERDWLIYKASAFFTSGDRDLNDGRATGFDAIVPNQQFAGGGFLGNAALADRGLINNVFEGGGTNFLNRQPVPLSGTGVFLFGLNSLIPSMRSSLFQGQASFINPGILLANVGLDAKLTPKLRSTVNVNYARFHRTEPLQAVLFQSDIQKSIGVDAGFGLQYRPLVSENILFTAGAGTLFPGAGFKKLYTGQTLFSGFVQMRFLF